MLSPLPSIAAIALQWVNFLHTGSTQGYCCHLNATKSIPTQSPREALPLP